MRRSPPTLRSYRVRQTRQDCVGGGWRTFARPTFRSAAACVDYFRRA